TTPGGDGQHGRHSRAGDRDPVRGSRTLAAPSRRRRMVRRWVALAAALVIVVGVAGCSSGGGSSAAAPKLTRKAWTPAGLATAKAATDKIAAAIPGQCADPTVSQI